MKPNFVWKFRPWKFIDFDYVMQKFDELVGMTSDLLALWRIRDRVEVFPHMVGAASRWRDDEFEIAEILDK